MRRCHSAVTGNDPAATDPVKRLLAAMITYAIHDLAAQKSVPPARKGTALEFLVSTDCMDFLEAIGIHRLAARRALQAGKVKIYFPKPKEEKT